MRGMRSVLATVKKRVERKGARGFDAIRDCDRPIRAELAAMLPYGPGRNRVDWLHHMKNGLEKCARRSIPDPYDSGITWVPKPRETSPDSPRPRWPYIQTCKIMEGRMKESGDVSTQPIEDMIFFITNLSSAIVDRMNRYCRC